MTVFNLQPRDGRFGSKVGQIGPTWDKSGAFSDQISVHLARGQNLKVLGWNGVAVITKTYMHTLTYS